MQIASQITSTPIHKLLSYLYPNYYHPTLQPRFKSSQPQPAPHIPLHSRLLSLPKNLASHIHSLFFASQFNAPPLNFSFSSLFSALYPLLKRLSLITLSFVIFALPLEPHLNMHLLDAAHKITCLLVSLAYIRSFPSFFSHLIRLTLVTLSHLAFGYAFEPYLNMHLLNITLPITLMLTFIAYTPSLSQPNPSPLSALKNALSYLPLEFLTTLITRGISIYLILLYINLDFSLNNVQSLAQDVIKELNAASLSEKLLPIFRTATSTPLYEELLFRTFLYRFLKKSLSPHTAAILTSILFSLAHLNLSGLIPLFFSSLLLCKIYEESGNFLAPVLLHSLTNLLASISTLV